MFLLIFLILSLILNFLGNNRQKKRYLRAKNRNSVIFINMTTTYIELSHFFGFFAIKTSKICVLFITIFQVTLLGIVHTFIVLYLIPLHSSNMIKTLAKP